MCRFLAVLALLAACEQRKPVDPLRALPWDRSSLAWTPQPSGEVAESGYVGSDACKKCHADQYLSYARHSMARSGLRPLSSLPELAPLFDGAPLVKHAQSGFSYRALRRGKQFFVEEWLGEEKLREVELTHALSAGSYGIAFYSRVGDRLYQAPVDYYPQVRAWGMDPGDVGGNARFAKALGPFCISCHSDYPRRRAGSEHAWLDPLPSGIGCERCHGPGEAHVKSLRKEDIVNPARLSRARQMDVCAQCHLSSYAELRAGHHEHDFRPGGRLDDVRVNFVAAAPDPVRIDLLSHTERLARSACWRKSNLTCISCHDPHKSSFDQPAAWWDGKCTQCHVCKQKQTAGCPGCHMRKGTPWNPPQVTMTDHFIQRRPPALLPGRPRADTLVPFFVGDQTTGQDLAALEVLALAKSGHRAQALAKVPAALQGWPRVPAVYDWLADQLHVPNDVLAAVTQALRAGGDDRAALLRYARLHLDAGHEGEAMRALDRLIAVDPDDAEALELEGMVKLRGGNADEAAALFKRAVQSPDVAAAHVGLAVLTKSRAELEAAHAVEPRDSWILEKLGRPPATEGEKRSEANAARGSAEPEARPTRNITPATGWLPPAYR